jgi:hypothetical protein
MAPPSLAISIGCCNLRHVRVPLLESISQELCRLIVVGFCLVVVFCDLLSWGMMLALPSGTEISD